MKLTVKKRLLIIGDSYVEGVGATNRIGWAQLLQKELSSNNIIDICGNGGDNILKVIHRIGNYSDVVYDLILLQIGLNDSRYRPSKQGNEVSQVEFVNGIQEFVNHYKKLSHNTLIIFIGPSIIDEKRACPYKDDKYYINENIELYNKYLQDSAIQNNIKYLRIPNLFINRCLSDGLHPNSKGHKLILQNVKTYLINNDLI